MMIGFGINAFVHHNIAETSFYSHLIVVKSTLFMIVMETNK